MSRDIDRQDAADDGFPRQRSVCSFISVSASAMSVVSDTRLNVVFLHTNELAHNKADGHLSIAKKSFRGVFFCSILLFYGVLKLDFPNWASHHKRGNPFVALSCRSFSVHSLSDSFSLSYFASPNHPLQSAPLGAWRNNQER